MQKSQSRFFQIWMLFASLLIGTSTPLVLADGFPQPDIPNLQKPPAQPIEKEPQDWLAFLAYKGGFIASVLDQTPYIMVFKDGRIFWRNDYLADDSREKWREAKLSPQKLADFKKKTEAFNFFTLKKVKPKGKTDAFGRRSMIVVSHADISLIGVQMHNKKRVVSEYALDSYANFDKNNRYLQTLVKMQQVIRALIPKESKRYEPKVIRVTLQASDSQPSVKRVIPNWPLADIPNTKIENHFYSGDNATTLIAALRGNEKVVINDKVYSAFWSPAIAVPQTSIKPVAAAETPKQ